MRPLPHLVAIGFVRCCGGWHGGALLLLSHCVHTPLGTWVAIYGCIRSSRQRYDFSVWRGYTRAHGLLIVCPAAILVRRQYQRHIFYMTGVWKDSAKTYDWQD